MEQWEARRVRLHEKIVLIWSEEEAEVISRLRPDGMVDVTVVSVCFEGLMGPEREALFWPAFETMK